MAYNRVVAASLACCVLAALPALADDRVAVSRADCQRLVAHVPAADVAYKPGVDVHGKAVASADLPGGGNDLKLLPDVIEFDYTINPVGYGQSKALAKQTAAQATQAASLATQSAAISKSQAANAAAQVASQDEGSYESRPHLSGC